MTESEWLNSADPAAMLRHLRTGGGAFSTLDEPRTDRKLRLFACACCRQVWDRIPSRKNRRVVAVAELYADGRAGWEEVELAERKADSSMAGTAYDPTDVLVVLCTYRVQTICEPLAARNREIPPATQAALLRDIFGNPWRPQGDWSPNLEWAKANDFPRLPPKWLAPILAWNDGTVPRLARAAYDGRRWEELPILADALEEAGCDNGEILRHLRGPGPHARGCWVVDLLLGKT